MHMERLARAQLIKLQVDQLTDKANDYAKAGDLERLTATRNEVEVLYQSLVEIRREQLVEEIERNQPKPPKPRWWCCFRHRQESAAL